VFHCLVRTFSNFSPSTPSTPSNFKTFLLELNKIKFTPPPPFGGVGVLEKLVFLKLSSLFLFYTLCSNAFLLCYLTFNNFLLDTRNATSQKPNSGCPIDWTAKLSVQLGSSHKAYYHPKNSPQRFLY